MGHKPAITKERALLLGAAALRQSARQHAFEANLFKGGVMTPDNKRAFDNYAKLIAAGNLLQADALQRAARRRADLLRKSQAKP